MSDLWYLGGGIRATVGVSVSDADAGRVAQTWVYPGALAVAGFVLPGNYVALEGDLGLSFAEKVFEYPLISGGLVQKTLLPLGAQLGFGVRFGRR